MKKRSLSPGTQGTKKIAPGQKVLTGALITCVAVFSVAVYASVLLKRLSYFKVKEVFIKESYRSNDLLQALSDPAEGTVDLSYLKGRTIFSLDLSHEASRILAAYPRYKKVRLIKIFPNRLFVHCIKRRAIAVVALPRNFFVGEDLALSPAPAVMSREDADLPVVAGLERKIASVRLGKKYFVPELMLAIGIVREVRINSELRNYSLKKIDVSNIENTSIFVSVPYSALAGSSAQKNPAAGSLEVKLGQDDIKAKISLLGELFLHYRRKLSLLEYVDLRFKEPVIKLKDEKK